jgi:MoaA/NifB/PqqE/SkfB family radical SAM enzyme
VATTALYEFTRTPELAGLAIEVARDGERLRTRFIGPWGARRSAFVRIYFSWLNRVKPLRIEGREGIWSLYFPPIPSAAHGSVIEAYLNTFLVKRQAPAAVTVGVTDACQYACVHCSAARRNGTGPRGNGDSPAAKAARPDAAAAVPLTLDELKRVVDESVAAGAGNVSFTGGEPLLYPRLEELVAHVPADHAVAQVFTNGRELTEKRAASLAAAGLHSVQVSVDSPVPEEHDRLRGETGAFAAARRAVTAARRAGLLVGVSTYATPASVRRGDVPALARLAAAWGACELTVFDAIPTGRLLGDTSVVLSKSDRRRLLLQSWTTNRAARRRFRVVTQTWTNSGRGFARFIGCLAGNCQFHVTASGEFQPCDFMPLSMGNVRDVSVGDLWRRTCDHPAFCRHSNACRMQSQRFRERYIERIPRDAALPYPMELLDGSRVAAG